MKLNDRFLKHVAGKILKYLNKTKAADIEIVFLSNNAIRSINKKYKGRNSSTDVLSFKIDRREFGSKKFLGEIFISVEKCAQNTKRFKTIFEEELVLYMIHGILHLFGYDDMTRKDKLRMSAKEYKILRHLCKTENLSRVLTRP